MKLKDVELYKPYYMQFRGSEKNDGSFVIFLDHAPEPLSLERNAKINSLSKHRWRDFNASTLGSIQDRDYNLLPFTDYQLVMRKLWEKKEVLAGEER